MTDSPRPVLVVTRNYPPLVGGMERLIWNLTAELIRHRPVEVVAPVGAAAWAPADVRVHEVPLAPLWKFLASALRQTRRRAHRLQPGVVLAGSGLTAPQAWLAARKCGGAALCYLHGLDIVVPHPVYRLLWRPFFRHMDGVIANSSATARLAREAGVSPSRIAVIPPGVHMPSPMDGAKRNATAAQFRSEYGLGPGPLLLSVGRLTRRKGLLGFVQDVLPLLVRQWPDIGLVIIGDAPGQALHGEGHTPERILAAAAALGLERRLHFLGKVPDETLEAAYWACDVHVFPLLELPGDPEGFGMVAVEAAAHGLPTVAYAVGGVVDAVAEGVSGRLVPPCQPAAFARAVDSLLETPLPAESMRAFASGFEWRRFGERVEQIVAGLMDRGMQGG